MGVGKKVLKYSLHDKDLMDSKDGNTAATIPELFGESESEGGSLTGAGF